MSRQKLINYHSDGTQPPLSASLELGEIAVQHNSGSTCLYVKDSAGTMRQFIDKKAVDKMIYDYLVEYGVIIPPPTVDLGLPSGTLWCEYNIGASTPYEAGLYFAWGEISGYTDAQVGIDKSFNGDGSDYQFGKPPSKYNETDGKSTLDDVDNAAKVHFGNGYTIPTKVQFEELTANTTSAFTQLNGVNGLLLTSTANTNTIFFPAANSCSEGLVYGFGDEGGYWSSSLNTGNVLNAWGLYFNSSGYYRINSLYRFSGFSVRPVVVQNQ